MSEPLTPDQYIDMQSEIQRRYLEGVREALQGFLSMIRQPDETDEQKRQRLRDIFAASALTGLCANSYSNGAQRPLSEIGADQMAQLAYEQADAMLAERDKQST